MYRMHQLRLNEIEAAKQDGRERFEVHQRLRNVEPLFNRRGGVLVSVSSIDDDNEEGDFSRERRKHEQQIVVSAWDFFAWFDALLIGMFVILLIVALKRRR